MPDLLVSMSYAGHSYRRGEHTVVALGSATCHILPRDRIALVGRSGSGKSTLLHLLAGIELPTSGTITWPALGAREILRPTRIGIVFQVPSLLAPLTVVENVELPLLLAQADTLDARQAALETLDQMQLTALAEKLPEELSGGQAQRVAVARSLVASPRLIVADEPTGQLDHPTAQHLFDVLLALLEGTDTALVVATHDKAIAERMQTIWQIHSGILEGNA